MWFLIVLAVLRRGAWRVGAVGRRGAGARDRFHRRRWGARRPAGDARSRVDPDRLGLAGPEGSRPEADRPRPEGPGRLRPSRPSGHDALAHGSLRRRGGAGQADPDRPLLGSRPAGGRRLPARFPRRSQARRPAGDRLSGGQPGEAQGAPGRRYVAHQRAIGAGAGLRRRGDRSRPAPGQARRAARRIPPARTRRPTSRSTRPTTPAAWPSCSPSAASSSSTPAT